MDLLFLDVEMEPCTGLEAARQIRQFNESLMIVFVTGFADFVFEGYQVRALDYLLKPVEETRAGNGPFQRAKGFGTERGGLPVYPQRGGNLPHPAE